MDEPLSNLDAKLRVQMRAEITRVHRRLGVATLYVTHDQIEAMTMGDRVAVMRGGVLQQIGSPQEIYNQPENLFVAAFIGSPAMNLYEAHVAARADSLLVKIGDQTLTLSGTYPALTDYVDRRVALGVRPEGLAPAATDHENGETLRVQVELVELLGPELLVHFSIDARRILPEDAGPEDEAPAELAARGGVPAITVAEGIAKANPREVINDGQSLMLAVDRRQLHFFDLQSGLAIR
jgi:multiple sugar transport system ATP-binding protein